MARLNKLKGLNPFFHLIYKFSGHRPNADQRLKSMNTNMELIENHCGKCPHNEAMVDIVEYEQELTISFYH